jgi:hypothetical protein
MITLPINLTLWKYPANHLWREIIALYSLVVSTPYQLVAFDLLA